ncbi:MAG TPA: twin-arginine translocase TatA/TatE family subunit [Candidatus Hydrogenedentes bacterium]|nr:twin-arginine translocase TatA/TatE family subunit [Candidatus Hydrogenedentota bacterium]HOL76543.1 twin-arginine translocase TatA/TatE family subunit [Candidatus Hydrogenedentota bacterium]HPO85207.1 twin-arginine translocase TatA/TatE family subunit [Candidatus Hydrogenedentota bacterium]
MFGVGTTELIIFLLIVLVVFGARRVPEIGRSLGEAIREFKDSISGAKNEPTTEKKDVPPSDKGE